MSTDPTAQQRCVLITGASGGLGRALARAFAPKAATVGLGWFADDAAAEETAQIVRQGGAEPVLLGADLTRPDAAAGMVKHFLEQTERRLDVLINNAGICRDAPLATLKTEDWDAVLAADLDAAAWTTKAAARAMMRRREGSIINISSHAAVLGRSAGSAYAAAKSGLIALTKSSARELGASGICVNAVLPGVLEGTGMAESANEAFLDEQRRLAVLGRLADTAEVAAFVVHLAEMRGVSGQSFVLDSRILRWG